MRDQAPLTGAIIGSAMEVHSALGPGLLKSACCTCLFHELRQRGLKVRKEVPLPLSYKGVRLDAGYRLDLVVEGSVIVEVKAVERVHPVAFAQVLTYLRLTGIRLGLLINFNTQSLRTGIRRIVLG
ncbi:MAG: GxxExxY protein [Gemmatimonadales bacterium]